MVQRKIDMNQSKLGIVTLDCNIPEDHISRFVVDFIDEFYPMLNIEEAKKKKGREFLPIGSMLKLLFYAKIEHMEGSNYIADMARYHEVYRFVF